MSEDSDKTIIPDDQAETPLPPPEFFIKEALPDLFRHYRERNDLYAEILSHANGENLIQKPDATRYQVRTLHMYNIRSYVNERLSRFLPVPRYRVVPAGISTTALTEASQLEKSLDVLSYWVRRNADSFGKCVADVLLIDGGVMRWEANVEAAFPDLITTEEGDDKITAGMPTGFEEEGLSDSERRKAVSLANQRRIQARERYKKDKGRAGVYKLFTHSYVPYNAYFPFPDSYPAEEVIEIEFRSLRKVVSNPLFDSKVTSELKEMMNSNGYTSFMNQVPIIRYCNKDVYAYYVVCDVVKSSEENDDTVLNSYIKKEQIGDVKLLYWYQHNAGMPLYTHFGGMHGGWGPSDNQLVKGKIKAMIDINTAMDELASQAYTNVRETFWPTLKITYSDARPAEMTNDEDPKKLSPNGTKDLHLYEGEDVQPLMSARDNPIFNNLYQRLSESMAKIGGAPGLYGVHQSGVEGGYQESMLIQQADSQFARIENNIVTGAQDDVIVLLSLIRAIGEKIWVRARSKKGSQEFFEDLSIDPEKLDPMPEIDAIVKARDIGSAAINLRNFVTAVADNTGPGTAAYDRITAREIFLDDEQPDDSEAKVQAQAISDALFPQKAQELVSKSLNLRAVQDVLNGEGSEAGFDPLAVLGNDPDAASQMTMFLEGNDPNAVPPAGTQDMQGIGGGLPAGIAQPESTAGRTDGLMMNTGLA